MNINTSLTTCAVAAAAALFAGTSAAQGMIVTCESQNYGNAQCAVPNGPVAIVRQLSTPPGDCIEGRTWGFNTWDNTIWVNSGCRAEFRVGYGGAYPRPVPSQGMTVVCESQNYRNAECAVPGGPVYIVQQLSTPPGDCVEGRTWGFNAYNNTIWVNSGCRAEFRVGSGGYPPPSAGMTVICESHNYRNAECAVSGGPVALIRQLSTPPGDCIEGRTWGFNGYNNTIWVTNGCRGEFRAGYGGYGRPR
jgi:Protein of unknown function (DUF3011)